MASTRETMFALVLSFMLLMGCSVLPVMSQLGQCYSGCGTELFICLSRCFGDGAGDVAQAIACGAQCNLDGRNCMTQCEPPSLAQTPNPTHL
ncbi:hypothetical protein ACHQM5_010767 [Ranunculus cassubicifolius]